MIQYILHVLGVVTPVHPLSLVNGKNCLIGHLRTGAEGALLPGDMPFTVGLRCELGEELPLRLRSTVVDVRVQDEVGSAQPQFSATVEVWLIYKSAEGSVDDIRGRFTAADLQITHTEEQFRAQIASFFPDMPFIV